MAPGGAHAARTVFVANIPYDVSEEQLAGIFSDVGPVAGVEIKFDPQTGRSKGYAFVQYHDESTALSAVRNLKEVQVNGRALRVEGSTEEPGPRQRRGGRSPPPMGGPPGVREPPLPAGVDLPRGVKAADNISKTLAAISPGQLQEVMANMKTLVATQPDQARTLLAAKPQLAYALFQAMLLMNIVDPAVLQRIQPQAAAPPPPVMYQNQPPPSIPPPQQAPPAAYPPYGAGAPAYPPFPPNAAAGPPPPAPAPYGRGYPPYAPSAPVPPPHAAPPPAMGATPTAAQAQAALSAANLPEDQKTMLMQVLQLTPEQINLLEPDQKASIIALRQQFLG